MEIRDDLLFKNEIIIYNLRKIYNEFNYKPYKITKFEEYDLYAGVKDYLSSNNIITFTDTNGKLMALKPDVTLSIVRGYEDNPNELSKVYYNENVYRIKKSTDRYKESTQVGIECMGNVTDNDVAEVLLMSYKSLSAITNKSAIVISQLDILLDIVAALNLSTEDEKKVLKLVSQKNIGEIKEICKNNNVDNMSFNRLIELCKLYGPINEIITKLEELCCKWESVRQLKVIASLLKEYGIEKNVFVDFSITNDLKYYNGIVFKGLVQGISTPVITGGQYDKLMLAMGKKSKAIGMAVDIDAFEYFDK